MKDLYFRSQIRTTITARATSVFVAAGAAIVAGVQPGRRGRERQEKLAHTGFLSVCKLQL